MNELTITLVTPMLTGKPPHTLTVKQTIDDGIDAYFEACKAFALAAGFSPSVVNEYFSEDV